MQAIEMTSRISIAMATYNGAKYLQEQLDSFLSQIRPPNELVVCDDGSTDDTVKLLEKFKKEANFSVRIYTNPINIGHERNFDKVIGLCEGEIIFLCDQDDVWFPNKILDVMVAFNLQHESVIVNNLEITDANLQSIGQTVLGELRESGLLGKGNRGLVIGCGSAFKRKILPLLLPLPNLNYGHDVWLHDVAQAIGTRFVLEKSLQFYRRHNSNASSFIFGGANRPTWKDLISSATDKDVRIAYIKKQKILSILLNRLGQMDQKAYEALGALKSYPNAVHELKLARDALDQRIAILDAKWLARKILSVRMGINGGYKYFLGWKSFAKDLLR